MEPDMERATMVVVGELVDVLSGIEQAALTLPDTETLLAAVRMYKSMAVLNDEIDDDAVLLAEFAMDTVFEMRAHMYNTMMGA
jgi:hypothetical protein